MKIEVDVQQTSDTPTGASASNVVSSLTSYAKLLDTVPVVRVMDLSGTGFLNDGGAVPVALSAISGKYGYISEPTNEQGTWTNAPNITLLSETEWPALSFKVQDCDGNQQEIDFDEITWTSGSCTIAFSEFTELKRMYITAVKLGKTFHFSNDDLVSLTCDLRGVNASLDEGSIELEMSSVDMSAYCGDGADQWMTVFASMDKSSPCRIMMGYDDDSVTRSFYISEQPSYDVTTKVLTVKMADATQMLDDNYGGKYIAGTTATIAENYYNTIKDILDGAGVEYTESGTVPTGAGSSVSNLFISNDSRRNIIANAVTLFRDDNKLAITYRDGGIPQLIAGQTNVPVWEINEEDVAELTTDIEYIVRDYSANLSSYVASATDEEVANQEGAIAGEEYILEASGPVYSITSATKGSAELITPYIIKFTCTTSGDATVIGKKIVADATTQYKTESLGLGLSVSLEDMQYVNAGIPSGGIPGYTRCEYIQSSGTQFIDTGIVPTANTSIEIDYAFTTAESTVGIIGSRPLNIGSYMFYGFYTGSNKVYQFRSSNSAYTNTYKTASTTRCTAKLSGGKCSITGGAAYSGTVSRNGTTTRPIYIFALNTNGTANYHSKIKVYGCRIYNGDELVRNFVPVYNGSAIGLYDLVNEEFYGNGGSGAFTKGPDAAAFDVVSLTKNGMSNLLAESNLKHKFTWRGNPHWQTLDHITMHMIDGTDKNMTLTSQTFTFECGGLICECEAREGWF